MHAAAMIRFLFGRLVHLVTVAAAIGTLTFAGSLWAPGTFEEPLRVEAAYSPGAVAGLRARQGLDRPGAERIGNWLASAARGELGVSLEYETPVAPLVAARAGRTLLLGLVATSIAWLIALPMGVWMAARAGSWYDRACRAGLAVALALPEPVLALVLVMLSIRTGLVPSGGMRATRLDDAASGLVASMDLAHHLVLPAVVLACGLLPSLARHVRSSLSGVLRAPFMTAARARGLPPRRLLFRCALRAAAAPLVSLFGLSIASLLSASLLVEVLTGWPGLGPLLVEATRSRDIPVVAGVSVCSIILLAIGRAVAEVAARLADPRTGGFEGARP